MKKYLIIVMIFMSFMLFDSKIMAKEQININNNLRYNLNTKISSDYIVCSSILTSNNDSIDWISLIGKSLNFLIKVAKKIGFCLKEILKILSGLGNGTGGVTTTSQKIITTTNIINSSTTTTITSKTGSCPNNFEKYSIGGILGIGSENYCVVNNYDAPITENMEQQKDYGDGCCNCYSAAYYFKIIGKNVDKQYWNIKDSKCSCTRSGLTLHNTGGESTILEGMFNSIIYYNEPAILHVRRNNNSNKKHYVVVIGIKSDSYKEYNSGNKSTFSLNDFIIMDVYDKSIYNAGDEIKYLKEKNVKWSFIDAQYK